MTIYEALGAVMKQVTGVAKKDKNTSPSGGFMFRGIDAVMNAVGPALRDHGVIVVPEVQAYDYGTVVVGAKQTQMGHAQVTVAYTFYGPEGDSIRAVTVGEAFDSGDKATAKAMSVALRTCLLQTLCLPTDEPDPDTESYQRAVPKIVVRPTNDADVARTRLRETCTAHGVSLATMVDRFRRDHGEELKTSTDTAAINALADEIVRVSK